MSTLISALSAAVIKSLTSSLPAATATKFNIPEVEFSAFLQEFLKEQLKNSKHGKSEKSHSHRVSGYNLFSKHLRTENKSVGFEAVGPQWKALSEAQKAEWNRKAAETNAATRAAAAPAVSTVVAAAPAPAVSESDKSEEESEPEPVAAPAPAKKSRAKSAAAKPGEILVSQDKSSKKWMVNGTNFFVQGPRNKVIVGKMVDGVEKPLDEADLAVCRSKEWKTGSAEPKKNSRATNTGARKQVAAAARPVVSESEDDE